MPRGTRALTVLAGLLAVAYLLLLVFVAYLATIQAASVLVPLVAGSGLGLVGSLAVLAANARLAAGRSGGPTRGLLWGAVALTAVGAAALVVVGIFYLISSDSTVGLITLASVILLLGPPILAALSLPAARRR
ncbi:hypothetical protein [Micromonospora vulcania]|uniref:Major facilitator superfamily (MFS) profile domain-containing protein n=1 Tax=Micromonospora vulcania TaxID=1441873 RepID=A0ABW1HAP6_9ACTN